MNSLPVNELLRIVQTVQAERRREAAIQRRVNRPATEVDRQPARAGVPSNPRREPGVTAHWRPQPPGAVAATSAAHHTATHS